MGNRQEINGFEAILDKTVFSGLETQLLLDLSKAAIHKSLDAGQCLYIEGEPCIGLYLVKTGKLKGVRISSNGREQVIRLASPGEVLNEIGAFINYINPLTVVAIVPSTVMIFERETILQMAKAQPQIYRLLVENLSSLVLHLFDLIGDLSFLNVEGRLARLMLDALDCGRVKVPFWSTQAELATYVGTTLVVMNRVLNDFVAEGIIHFDRNQIDILNLPALRDKVKKSYK